MFRACVLLLLVGFSLAKFPHQQDVYVQYVDHFNLMSYGAQTFNQRFLYQDKFWGKDGSPIFFYAGGRGSIESQWDDSGFIHEIAPQFKAYVVFVEHRFYGYSLPFGKKSFKKPYLGLLSVDQAVADYTVFLTDLKKELKAPNSKVIVFGGGYGGLLATYLRYKHPSLVAGALASSTPVLMQAPDGPHDFFFQDVTKIFKRHSEKCYSAVKEAFAVQLDYSRQGVEGLVKMSKKMRLCKYVLEDYLFRVMQMWGRYPFVQTSMWNYPYAAHSLPANPVSGACETILKRDDPLVGLVDVADMIYNTTGTKKCYNISEEYHYCADPTGCGLGNDRLAWEYQTCADLYVPNGSNNETDMFPDLPWNAGMRKGGCKYRYGVIPRIAWDSEEFFGLDLRDASNIIFSNGDLDPWMRGGVTKDVSSTVVSLIVKGGAHQLDLRASHKQDPPSVVDVRKRETTIISSWLKP